MPVMKLSKSIVERLNADDREKVFWDDALKGFGVRVKPNGTKSYVVQYRNRITGRSRRQTVGQAGPLLSFASARREALRILSEAAQGGDPVEAKLTARKAETIADLADQYLTHHAKPKKRKKSVANDISMLDGIIIPELGNLKVAEVSHRHVQALHNNLFATPYRANRTLALLSKMFALAIRWGWRHDNPAKGIDRFPEEKRYRWLSDAELDRLVAALNEHPNQLAANAIRLQLLTGARIGEVLTSKWADFDLVRGVWVKPSHHTKQKRTEHLPLSGTAVTLLQNIREKADLGHPYVFPGKNPGQPLKDLKRFWRTVTGAAELSDYRNHDNRHTHASHLVSSGLSLAIVGRLLGHTNPLTTHRYAHLADDPLRAASEVMAKKMGH